MFPNLRYAIRQMLKAPGFSLTVVVVLALGIGATTAIYSVIEAVLLNPFPYKRGNEILFVGSSRTDQPGSQMPVTYPDYLELRKQAQTTEDLSFASGFAVLYTGGAEPVTLRDAAISANAWELLGMQPALGRVFTEAEDHVGADPVCVLSHATWQNRFEGDPAVLGKSINLDGHPHTVIGVMPANFKFWAGDVWTPVGLLADTDSMRSRVMRIDSWVVTRPKPGRTADDVRAELNVIARQIAQRYPESNKDVGVELRPLAASVSGPLKNPLLVLLASVVAVLLIACANVANLFLARTSARQREFAVRAAIGAGRRQLIWQNIVECLPLAILGGASGLLLASWGLGALLSILPSDFVPAESQIVINGRVMLFSIAVTLGTMLLFALFPALDSSRAVGRRIEEGSRGTVSGATSRMRAGLIIAEVSLSLILLVGAGLFIRSLARASTVDVGFERENLLVVPIQLPESGYAGSEQATTFFENAVDRISELPQVSSVAATTSAPFSNITGMPLAVEGRTYTELNQLDGLIYSTVTKDYFRAQGMSLVKGRLFEETDRAGTEPVIVLNEAAVKKFLPEGDPLGRRVMLGAPENLLTPGMLPVGFDKFQWSRVVGVVRDLRYFGQQTDAPPAAYIPVRQSWDYPPMRRAMMLLVRTTASPLDAVPSIRGVIKALDPKLPLGRIATVDMLIGDSLKGSRFNTVLLGIFAGVALALAAVGIYGVVAWQVTQRTKEIGVRVALGACRSDVIKLILGQAMRVVLIGVAVGLAGSLALAKLLQSLLFNTSPFDPVTFVVVALVLSGIALLACLLPARRATKVDPMVALRAE